MKTLLVGMLLLALPCAYLLGAINATVVVNNTKAYVSKDDVPGATLQCNVVVSHGYASGLVSLHVKNCVQDGIFKGGF